MNLEVQVRFCVLGEPGGEIPPGYSPALRDDTGWRCGGHSRCDPEEYFRTGYYAMTAPSRHAGPRSGIPLLPVTHNPPLTKALKMK